MSNFRSGLGEPEDDGSGFLALVVGIVIGGLMGVGGTLLVQWLT